MPPIALFLVVSLIWGTTYFAITLQLGEVAPTVSVAYRFAVASAMLFLWCVRRGDKLWLPWRVQRWLLFQGVAIFGLTYIFIYQAEQYLVSGLISVIFALCIFWSPFCERLAFGTPLSWRSWVAASAAIGGVAMMCLPSLGATWHAMRTAASGGLIMGIVSAIVGSVTFSVGNLAVVKARQYTTNALLTLAWAMLWGSLAVALWIEASGTVWTIPSRTSYWLALLYLSVIGSVVTYSAFFSLVHRIGAQKAMYIEVVTPAIAILLSMHWENYRPGAFKWCGILLALSSVAWAIMPRRVGKTAIEPA